MQVPASVNVGLPYWSLTVHQAVGLRNIDKYIIKKLILDETLYQLILNIALNTVMTLVLTEP